MNPPLHICTHPDCRTLIPHSGRCPAHPLPRRGHAHAQARAQTLAEETTCWICHRPGTADDPLTADHVIARADDGPDHRSNYRAAHLSCNLRRGAGYRGEGEASRTSQRSPDDSASFSANVRLAENAAGVDDGR